MPRPNTDRDPHGQRTRRTDGARSRHGAGSRAGDDVPRRSRRARRATHCAGSAAPARGRLHRVGSGQGMRDARSRCRDGGARCALRHPSRHAGGGVCAPCRRCRRPGRGLRTRFAPAAPRGLAAARAPQSAARGLLDHGLWQARALEGRASDRGPRAGAHGSAVGHARLPSRTGARRASAAERRRGPVRGQWHRRSAACPRDDRPGPPGRDLADGGRAAVSDQGHRRAARAPRVPDAPLGQRSVLQRLSLRRRPVGAARLRPHRLHHHGRQPAWDRRPDRGAALQYRQRRSDSASRRRAARSPHPHPAIQALRRVGSRVRGRRCSLRPGTTDRGWAERPPGAAQRHGHDAGRSGRRADCADGRAGPPERDAGPCARSPPRSTVACEGPGGLTCSPRTARLVWRRRKPGVSAAACRRAHPGDHQPDRGSDRRPHPRRSRRRRDQAGAARRRHVPADRAHLLLLRELQQALDLGRYLDGCRQEDRAADRGRRRCADRQPAARSPPNAWAWAPRSTRG